MGVEIFAPDRDAASLNAAQADFLMRQAAAALRRLADTGHDKMQVAMRLPWSAMLRRDFADLVLWECDRLDVSPGRLLFEMIAGDDPGLDAAPLRDNLSRLAAAGCGLDLDILTPTHKGLTEIAHRASRRLRIEPELCRGSHNRQEQSRLILAMIALADHLGLPTLASGVDAVADHGWLAQIGCDMAEGAAVAEPITLEELLTQLTDQGGQGTTDLAQSSAVA
ncbi:MAG: EAL domain-containing protein [Paracoccus sp. (in: a-proteobacteria)]|nr:EAL domain-containing protein [Paracoccus sp. (in: a-proteobacteria)]